MAAAAVALLPTAAVESDAIIPVRIALDGGQPQRTDREGVIKIVFGCGARVRPSPDGYIISRSANQPKAGRYGNLGGRQSNDALRLFPGDQRI
jgi:hypothetical protein